MRGLRLSIVTLIGITGLWLYSLFSCPTVRYGFNSSGFNDERFTLSCANGVLQVYACPRAYTSPYMLRPVAYRWTFEQHEAAFFAEWLPFSWQTLGFHFERGNDSGRTSASFALPLWALWCACAVTPVLRWRRSSLRRSRNLCGTCGYDLRASSERCPECGAPCGGLRSAS